MSENPYLDLDRNIIADAYTSDYTEIVLRTLCDTIGIRFSGTEGERRGAEYIAGEFRRLDAVRIEEFPFTSWRRGPAARCVLDGVVRREIPCLSLPFGAPTPTEGVTGRVVDIGPGAPDEIERRRDEIRGCIVMTEATAVHRGEIYGRVSEAGATAFVLKGRESGMILPTGCVSFGAVGKIPAVGIARESGLLFERFGRDGEVTLNVSTFDRFEKAVSCNVVGELRGTKYPDEYVVVGGHMDSHDVAPGAVDNASGTTCVVEVARLLAAQKDRLDRSVRFVAFGSEEVGLLGSYRYAAVHADEIASTRLMLNIDCVSMARPKGFVFHRVPGAKEYVDSLRIQMREPLPYVERIHSHSDHFPFLLAGVPTAEIFGEPFNAGVKAFAHMAGDTTDKVSVIDLREQSALAARLIVRAANDPRWPLRNRTPDEVNTLLEETGIVKALAYEHQAKNE